MFNVIKKADILLFVVLILLGLCLTAAAAAGDRLGETAVVTVNGKVYGTYSLSRDREITIRQHGHTNKFSIKDGAVQMTYSDCKNQICVEKGAIRKTSQSIVCLPNKVVIEIRGGDDYDAVSR